MLTLDECRDSSIADIDGVTPTSPKFISLINDACRRLARRGDWDNTVVPIHVCVKNGCVVFPRYVGHVRNINRCNRPMPVRSLWYNFIDRKEWGCGSWRGGLDHHASGLTVTGEACAYSDIYGDGRTVRAYPMAPEDVTARKQIRIFGVDNNNQPLVTHNNNGTWSEGVSILLTDPYGETTMNVRRIDRVIKDVTQGQVFLYAYNTADAVLEDLAIYDPGETNPSYVRYRINTPHFGGVNCSSGSCSNSVVALVKLKFIPAKFGTDLVMIDNIDALKEMVQSVKLREAYDMEGALQFEASAVRELNRSLEDANPDTQFVAENNVLGRGVRSNRAF